MRFCFFVACLLLPLSLLTAQESVPRGLTVGDPAPDFSLPYATKDSISDETLTLSAFMEKRTVVLAFYPADWSGGCTKEVCALRDNFSALAELDAEILAISGDYVYSHFEWAKFHHLPFRLVSDHFHKAATEYGSYNEATGMNRRTVVVIKKGKIAYIDQHYSVRDMDSITKLQNALTSLKEL